MSRLSSFGEKGSLGMFSLEKCVAWSALRNRRPQLRNFLVRCKLGVAAFMASFGPFWLRFGARVRVRFRVRVRVRVRDWVGSSPVT